MQRIKIFENDNTYNTLRAAANASTGYVLIPGFASKTSNALLQKAVGEVVECDTLAMFRNYFGDTAPVILDAANIYPTTDAPDTVDTVESKAKLEEKYKLTAVLFNKDTAYAKGAQCINGDSLWQWDHDEAKPEGTDWVEGDWTKLLTSKQYVKVAPPANNKYRAAESNITYYQYIISNAKGQFNEYTLKQFGFPNIAIPTGDENGSKVGVRMFKKSASTGKAYDPSWIMAAKLLQAGLRVAYVRMNESLDSTSSLYDVSPERAYTYMHDELFKTTDEFSPILDKNINIHFITSGGYPVLEHTAGIAEQMIALATSEFATDKVNGRGDCVAIIDHTNNPERPLVGEGSVFVSGKLPESSYATVFTPWFNTDIDQLPQAPASFAYLYNVASNGGTNSSWTSLAGVSRGYCKLVKTLNTNKTLTNKIAEYYQNDFDDTSEGKHISMNAITYIRNYGYCIWGDRTCECFTNGETGLALAFLHTRNLVSAVKKKVYSVSQEMMFETNNELLWTKFKSRVSEVLDQMKASNNLSGYVFTRVIPENDQTALYATLTLFPTYNLEKIELTINLENDADLIIGEE